MNSDSNDHYDVIVIGAGFSGLYALYRLRERLGLKVKVFEAGGGVGGTWYWNRYPGCRCDVPSINYSFSFSEALDQEWSWSEKCATQPEIERYLNHVADRFDLRRDIQLNARVVAAEFDENQNRWVVRTNDGAQVQARFLVSGVGMLSSGYVPALKGLDTFSGNTYFTGDWPHNKVDFSGQRVGVIGTGSTGIQVIPEIAREAAHLTVFQRTPNYSIPSRNAPMSAETERKVKERYPEIRRKERSSAVGLHDDPPNISALEVSDEERLASFEKAWQAGGFRLLTDCFKDLGANREANRTISEFLARKIRERVRDPILAEKLIPTYPFGARRPALDTNYFETLERDNVGLVDLREAPITEVVPGGIRTGNTEHRLDSIVFATGFDGFTGSLIKLNLRGRGGMNLADYWLEGPRTRLGFATRHFPNFFMVGGPQSGAFFNLARVIEQHVDWIAECIAYTIAHGHVSIEVTADGEDHWAEVIKEAAEASFVPETDSWWMGSNIPGKPRVILRYIGSAVTYRSLCAEVVAKGYEGFAFDKGVQ